MNPSDLTKLRNQLGLSCVKFWKAIKVNYASGWRYENREHRIPEPVKELIRLRYELGIDLNKINEHNAPLICRILSTDQSKISTVNGVLDDTETIAKAASRIIDHHVKTLTEKP